MIEAIKTLAQKHGDQLVKVSLFGSRARGDHQKTSDFDLFVQLKHPENRSFLQELDALHTLYKIDVTVYREDLQPHFLEEIKKEEVILYMGKFHQRFSDLKKAVSKLQENHDYRTTEMLSPQMEEILRDSDIKRFEFTYELSWKTLKEYLKEEGMAVESTPRGILKQAFGVGLLEDDAPWLSMISDRNQTCHEYNQEVAVELVERIQRMYLPAFQILVDTLEKEGNS